MSTHRTWRNRRKPRKTILVEAKAVLTEEEARELDALEAEKVAIEARWKSLLTTGDHDVVTLTAGLHRKTTARIDILLSTARRRRVQAFKEQHRL